MGEKNAKLANPGTELGNPTVDDEIPELQVLPEEESLFEPHIGTDTSILEDTDEDILPPLELQSQDRQMSVPGSLGFDRISGPKKGYNNFIIGDGESGETSSETGADAKRGWVSMIVGVCLAATVIVGVAMSAVA